MSEVLDRIEKRGVEKGIETVNMLNARLIKEGRIKDLERSVTDSVFREQLLGELFKNEDARQRLLFFDGRSGRYEISEKS